MSDGIRYSSDDEMFVPSTIYCVPFVTATTILDAGDLVLLFIWYWIAFYISLIVVGDTFIRYD